MTPGEWRFTDGAAVDLWLRILWRARWTHQQQLEQRRSNGQRGPACGP